MENGRRKVCPCDRFDPLAQLLPQVPGLDLSQRALRQRAELERTKRHPNQPIYRQPEMPEYILDLAVLALAHREGEPHIGALLAVDLRLDRAIADTLDGDAVAERREPFRGDAAVSAHAIAPQPAGGGQFDRAREAAVIGEQQQAFGDDIEA